MPFERDGWRVGVNDMKLEITQRDKKLLKIFAMVLLLFGYIYFFLLPKVEHLSQLQEKVEVAEEKQEALKKKIANLPVDQKEVATEKQRIKEASKDLYDDMDNSQIDKLVTNMILKHGLSAQSLDIEVEPTYKQPAAYDPKDDGEEASENSTEDTGDKKEYSIAVTKVKASVNGKKSNFIQLLDEVFHDCPAMKVVDFQTTSDTVFSLSQTYVENSEMSVTMEIHMYEKENLE